MPVHVDLLWLPLGAGSHVVPRCGRVYERVAALVERRAPRPLFHAALQVGDTVVEVAPAWTRDPGVVATGPVGLRRSPLHYVIRRWEGGTIPDAALAAAVVRVSDDAEQARRVLAAVGAVPIRPWTTRWNSNSVVAFVLAQAGIDTATLAPPDGGRAPGWAAGGDHFTPGLEAGSRRS